MEFLDSTYADDSSDYHFTNSITMILSQATCICNSTKQKIISISSTKAEYVSLCKTGKQLVGAKYLFYQLRFCSDLLIKFQRDNRMSLAFIWNLKHHLQLKYIDVPYNYVRKLVEDRAIQISYLSISKMVVKIFTKLLTSWLFY